VQPTVLTKSTLTWSSSTDERANQTWRQIHLAPLP
jgi:hypothetical protein